MVSSAAAVYSDDPLPLGYFSPKEGAEKPNQTEVEHPAAAQATRRTTPDIPYMHSGGVVTRSESPVGAA